MQDALTLASTTSITRGSRLASVQRIARPVVISDPNNARAKRREKFGMRFLMGTMVTPIGVGAIASFIAPEAWLMYAYMSISASFILPAAFVPVFPHYRERTLTLPEGTDTGRIETMLAMLVHVSHEGLRGEDRRVLQSAIDDASDLIEALTGATPRASLEGETGTVVPTRISDRGERLRTLAPALLKEVDVKGGAEMKAFRSALNPMVQIIEALIRDFGLDPAGFGPPAQDRHVPGTGIEARTASEDPLSPAAGVRRLAREWAESPRRILDDATANAADAAGTSDLDRLESEWAIARAHAVPQDAEPIDADFASGCRMLSARISSAIIQQSAVLRDGVATERRFLEAKHADAMQPVLSSIG